MSDDYSLHRSRRALFGTDAEAYERGRPSYPPRVYELLETCGLRTGCRVVEIGPGTGQATRELVRRGAIVTAVELDHVFAAKLRSTFAGADLDIVVGAFEEVDLPAGAFDLVVAATSFHWVVPVSKGLAQCARLLRPGGWLALWWTVFGDESRPDPFREALQPVLADVEPTLAEPPIVSGPFATSAPYARNAGERIGSIDSTDLFGPVAHEVVAWTGRHSAAEIRALFASFSPWLAIPEDRRTVALDRLERLAVDHFGGIVERPYLTPIYLAQRR